MLVHTMGCFHWVVPWRVSIGIQVLEKRNINRDDPRECDNGRSKLEGAPMTWVALEPVEEGRL